MIFRWANARRLSVAFTLLGGYRSTDFDEEAVARLHRIVIAAAALANEVAQLDVHDIMELAATQNGSEGFSFDWTGRKTDAGFHAELLGDEEDDPFAYDLDALSELSTAAQERFLRKYMDHAGRVREFMRELLDEDRDEQS
jgi:hypothetical protein